MTATQVGDLLQITTEITKDGKRLNSRTYDLDTKRNWLPTRVLTWRDEDLINDVTEFEFDEVLPEIWFMKRVTEKYAGLYQIREITPEVQWSQTIITLTFGKPEFNVPITEEELTSLKSTRP